MCCLCREVTHAVMRNRLDALQSDFQALQRQGLGDPAGGATGAAGTSHPDDADRWSDDEEGAAGGNGELLGGALVETERERQIRLGLITPFHNLQNLDKQVRAAGLPYQPAGLPYLVSWLAPLVSWLAFSAGLCFAGLRSQLGALSPDPGRSAEAARSFRGACPASLLDSRHRQLFASV